MEPVVGLAVELEVVQVEEAALAAVQVEVVVSVAVAVPGVELAVVPAEVAGWEVVPGVV